ncbi:hypothetical protein [Agrobacterium fabrum]|uniref:hypothetical protein n=1 Tax=Agrobacterium fabrum TaxID=1176649 RepID=UPI00298F2FAF|nr:hypothetical protein [Agrobacterium fabrum]
MVPRRVGYGVVVGGHSGSSIKLKEVSRSICLTSSIGKRTTERREVFDRVADGLLECTAPQAYGQLDAKDLELPSNFVFEVKGFSLRLLRSARV